jgi:hypothetical protein
MFRLRHIAAKSSDSPIRFDPNAPPISQLDEAVTSPTLERDFRLETER